MSRDPSWESICKRCGLCCFEKFLEEDGRIRHTSIPCRHLDIVTRECRVYHKRLEVGEGCIALTPEAVRSSSWLPADCAYVRFVHRSGKRKTPRKGKGHG